MIKIFKEKFLNKTVSVFLLLLMLESILAPTITYALTTGPHQPEFTSYEEPGATDMVNLLTGDFSTSLPLLDVPSPEGHFSVPLTYNAGIGPEQEASWVGLGWTMNVGGITRQINQYPDDASGETQAVRNVNLQGVRGWTSSALGLGQIGWNTQQGHYGSLSLLGVINASYDNHGLSSAGLIGVSVGRGKMGFNPMQFASGVITIATLGIGSEASAALQAAEQVGVGAALSVAFSAPTPGLSPSSGYWALNHNVHHKHLFHTDYWLWLDDTRNESMYGILNLGSPTAVGPPPPDQGPNTFVEQSDTYSIGTGSPRPMPRFISDASSASAATSDINYYVPPTTTYEHTASTSILALDNFSVNAPGIQGRIEPYRLEVGNVSMPYNMTSSHVRFAPIPFLNSYKVPFIYSGSLSSRYLYHTGNASTPNFGFGLTSSFSSYTLTNLGLTYGFWKANFGLLDPTLASPRVDPAVSSTNYKLPQANHVEWLSNSDISSNTGSFSNGFMDYFIGPGPRGSFRSAFPFNGTSSQISSTTVFNHNGIITLPSGVGNFPPNTPVKLDYTISGHAIGSIYTIVSSVNYEGNVITVAIPKSMGGYDGQSMTLNVTLLSSAKPINSIGGFSITAVNGLTYHFALPVYDYQNSTTIANLVSGTTTPDNTKYSTVTRNDGFANTWLLTGITGSDFVDRNANGIIDTGDWGYWVKFNYGSASDRSQWRIPFAGYNLTPTGSSLFTAPSSSSYSQGYKQLYYLNSIETRSHVALFIKDNRDDNYDVTLSTGTLRLSEIALLRRQDYAQVCNSTYGQSSLATDSGTINSLWMYNSIYNTTPAIGNFIAQNALKRIKFTYDYSLCKLTPNSLDGTADANGKTGGKLTLNRVSILGRNSTPVVPDYLFAYGTLNPTYDPNKWDGWGYYNSFGTSAYNTHSASQQDSDASAWSLSQITTPEGSKINISYERDTYTSISGNPLTPISAQAFSSTTNSPQVVPTTGCYSINLPSSGFRKGDVVSLNGTYGYATGSCTFGPAPLFGNYTIASVQSTGDIYFTSPFGQANACPGFGGPIPMTYSGTMSTVTRCFNGGGVRVGSITMNDNNVTYKQRYLYTNPDGTSSGVVSQEAPYTTTSIVDFDAIPGYPVTPVLYSAVTVLSGNLSTDSDYTSKVVYQFEPPNSNLISLNPHYLSTVTLSDPPSGTPMFSWSITTVGNEVSDYSSKIGSLNAIKTYDGNNTLISTTSMQYTNQLLNNGQNNYQGLFSSGTLMFESMENYNENHIIYKLSKSTIVRYPYTLQSVSTQKDGFTEETDNISWDFISGAVVESNSISPLGIKTKSVIIPAYTISLYSQMGPIAWTPAFTAPAAPGISYNYLNKNMLTQPAAQYVYRLDPFGNITGLLSAQATTWRNSWNNYRDFNGTTYVESSGTAPLANVWRPENSYAYKGTISDLQNDGSLKFNTSTDVFDFTGAPNTKWQQTASITRYDHYSMAVESIDKITNISSSTKRDFNTLFVLASAQNANYYEFAYSGAEDGTNTSVFFGGEVALNGAGVISGTPDATGKPASIVHSGQQAIQVGPGATSFVYKPASLVPNRMYRAQVWTNSLNGAIYYQVNGASSVAIAPLSINKAGNWYKIIADIPIPSTFSSLEVGVTSSSGIVSFDDFRFQPRDGSVQAKVYDASTGYLTYTLDDDNTYTRYFYDDRGILTQTFLESIKYNGERRVTQKKDDYKRFHP